jgi:hypothetical protein
MRVRFPEAVRLGWRWCGQVVKPAEAPPGYTPNTVVTEWLTLNCLGAWASEGHSDRLYVRFAREEDARRAREHFSALDLWRDGGREGAA